MGNNLGSCFYVASNLIPKPLKKAYNELMGENLEKLNPARAKLR